MDSYLKKVRKEFEAAQKASPQERGYALERVFAELMRISNLLIQGSFALKGEQIDGAIKHEGIYYIIELKWHAVKIQPNDVAAFHFKVEGRLDARGIYIAMNGYTDTVVETLQRGKNLRVILLDGNHLANVIYGQYTFQQLLDHALQNASLKGQSYCSHHIKEL